MAQSWTFVGERRPPREMGVVQVAASLARRLDPAQTGEAVTYPGPPAPPPTPQTNDTHPTDPYWWTRMVVVGFVVGLVPGAAVGWLFGSTLVGAAAGGTAVATTLAAATFIAGAEVG